MFASSFLDIAIGMVFVFLLISLVVSAVNELIQSGLAKRGRFLLEGIKTLLDDTTGTGLVSAIYNHGQVYGLYRGEYTPSNWRNLPSYIPARNFAMAFLGVLPDVALPVAEKTEAAAMTVADEAEEKARQSPGNTALAVIAQKAREAANVAAATKAAVTEGKAALASLSLTAKSGIGLTAAAKSAFDAAAAADAAQKAANDAKKAADASPADQDLRNRADELARRAADAKMVRAAADQVLQEQTSSLQIAAAFQSMKTMAGVLAQNASTEKVGKPVLEMLNQSGNDVDKLKASLEAWYNSAMDRVSGWYKRHTQWWLFGIGLVLAVALNADTINIATQLSKNGTLRESVVAAAQSYKNSSSTNSGDPIKDVSDNVKKINELGIPIGWSDGPQKIGFMMMLGWLLTAVAVSLGAPFWFDMLNKFMIVRSTVKPQEKSGVEASKDKAPAPAAA